MDETTSNERLALVKPYTQRSFVHNQKENRSLDTVSSIEAIALDAVNSSGQFAAATLPRSVGLSNQKRAASFVTSARSAVAPEIAPPQG